MIQKNTQIVLRKVGEFYFLVDPKKSYNNDDESLFQTDEIGASIWDCLEEKSSFEEVFSRFTAMLTDELSDELLDEIRLDMKDFLKQLQKNGFILED